MLGSVGSFSVEMVAILWRVQPVGMEPLLLHTATPIMEVKVEVNSFSRKGTASRSTVMTMIGPQSKPSIVAGGAAVGERSGDEANEGIVVAEAEEASARGVKERKGHQEVGVDRTMGRPRRGQRGKPASGPFIHLGTISGAAPPSIFSMLYKSFIFLLDLPT